MQPGVDAPSWRSGWGNVVSTVSPSRQMLFGMPVDGVTLHDVVRRSAEVIEAGGYLDIGDLNAAKVIALRSDPSLRSALLGCDVLLPDGQSVVWASRFLGGPLPARVAGIDVFQALLELADERELSVFFLGSRPEVLDRLRDQVGQRWPRLRIAGMRDGYFADEEEDAVADHIRRASADLVFLGMPTPKKELFAQRYGPTLGARVLQAPGGSFDVVAGALKRAPRAWQAAGMEWAFRLLQEPRRLWRRYLTTNTAFLALMLLERLRRTPPAGTV